MRVLTTASMGGASLRIPRSNAAGPATPSAAEPRPWTGRVLEVAASGLTSLQGVTASRRRSANAKRQPVTDRVSTMTTTTTTTKRNLHTSSPVFSAIHARLRLPVEKCCTIRRCCSVTIDRKIPPTRCSFLSWLLAFPPPSVGLAERLCFLSLLAFLLSFCLLFFLPLWLAVALDA